MVDNRYIICFRVRLNCSATWALVSSYVTKWWTPCCLGNHWKVLCLNSVPASVCNLSALPPARKIVVNTCTRAEPVFVFKGTAQACLDKVSMQAMVICRKRSRCNINFQFGNHVLELNDELEMLGISIDSKLLWAKHLCDIFNRAGQRIGALIKLVQSVMEYAMLSWINAWATHLNQLDNIQRKALQIIGSGKASVCKQLTIPSLSHQRHVPAVKVMYKMHTDNCPVDLKFLLPPPYERRGVTRSSLFMPLHALFLPAVRTSTLDRGFIPTGVRLWNSVPDHTEGNVSAVRLQVFKCREHGYLLNLTWYDFII